MQKINKATQKPLMLLFAVLAIGGVGAGSASAATMGFVSNPTGNSIDWTNSVTGFGATVNTNVNFDSHPLGGLNGNFYSVSDGVTLSTSGDITTLKTGAGPGQSNTSSTPRSPGEGVHAPSNYLFDGGAPSSLTVSFATPVFGAGLFTIDYFNPTGSNPLRIQAFTGQDGTGSLLGSFDSVAFNFQRNGLYFMGVSSSAGDIGSIVYTDVNSSTGDTLGVDNIVFATGGSPGQGPAPVPEPSTIFLFGSGLAGLAAWRVKKGKQSV